MDIKGPRSPDLMQHLAACAENVLINDRTAHLLDPVAFSIVGVFWTGGPPFLLLLLNSFPIRNEGAPSLRFLQGWAAMLHALLDRLRPDKDQQTCASISGSRPSQRTPRTGHPSVLLVQTRSKGLGHPPPTPLCW